jgi:hypothetical protein
MGGRKNKLIKWEGIMDIIEGGFMRSFKWNNCQIKKKIGRGEC